MLISVLVPFYNEEKQFPRTLEVLQGILEDIKKTQGDDYEFIFVDDGSKDDTWNVMKKSCSENTHIHLIKFSRNFGKEAAVCAAFEAVRGDCAILLDGDLQHPPTLIPQMIQLWKEGAEVVDAVKKDRGKESKFNRFMANTFYSLFGMAGDYTLKNASDFKLLDRKAVEALKLMQEKGTFFRGMGAWIGFNRETLFFEVEDRLIGETKWSFRKKLRLSLDALTSFSSKPLELILSLGLAFWALALVLGIRTLVLFFKGTALGGFTTVILLQLIIGGSIFFCLGILGLYISRIYDEVKGRPRYIISENLYGNKEQEDEGIQRLKERL